MPVKRYESSTGSTTPRDSILAVRGRLPRTQFDLGALRDAKMPFRSRHVPLDCDVSQTVRHRHALSLSMGIGDCRLDIEYHIAFPLMNHDSNLS